MAKKTKKTNNLTQRQIDFIEIFKKNMGLLIVSCAKANVKSPKTFYRWLEIPKFKEEIELARLNLKDFGESALISLLRDQNPAVVLHFNKTKNRDRGYGEQINIEHSGSKTTNVQVSIINPNERDKVQADNKTI